MEYVGHIFIVGVVTALTVPIIVVVTVALVVLILSSAQLRQSLRHLVYASMSVSDLIVGLLCCIFISVVELRSTVSKINCQAAVVAGAYFGTVSMFITFWSLVLLHVLFIVRHGMQLLHISPMKLSPLAETVLRVVVALSPWLFMFALLPGMLAHFSQRKYSDIPQDIQPAYELCHRLQMKRWIWLLFHSLCLYVPACLAAVLCVVSAVVFVLRRRNIRVDSTGLLDEPATDVEHPRVLIAGTLVAIFLIFPFNIKLMIWHLLELDDAEKIFKAFLYLRLLTLSKAFVLPAVWFADKGVRERVLNVLPEWCRVKFPCCRRGDGDTNGVTVTYQDLVESDNATTESRAV